MRQYSAEEKMRIVMEGLRGEEAAAELYRREGFAQSLYYRWSKKFSEVGKAQFAGDTKRRATNHEVQDLRQENGRLKPAVAKLPSQDRVLKKV